MPLFLVQRDNWAVEEVIRIPAKDVTGWIMPKMPGLCAPRGVYIFPPGALCRAARQRPLTDPRRRAAQRWQKACRRGQGLCKP